MRSLAMVILLRSGAEYVAIGHRLRLKHDTLRARAKRMVVWLILVAVSLQGAASVTAVLQGPAHFHLAPQAPGVHHLQHTGAAQHSDHSHHDAQQVRRHYHLPDEGAVLAPDNQPHDVAAIADRSAKGESVSAAFLAVMPESLPLNIINGINNIEMYPAKKLRSSIPRRIERPPRLTHA